MSLLNINPKDIYNEEDMSSAEEYKESVRSLITKTEEDATSTLKNALGHDEVEYDKNFLEIEPKTRKIMMEQLNKIEIAKQKFKKDFGHEVTEKVKIRLDSSEIFAPGADVQQIQNMQMLDDSLVRKITMHLRDPKLRITRISEQISELAEPDNIYNLQKFDMEGYEKLEQNMTTQDQEAALVAELKKKQEDIQKSLMRRGFELESLKKRESKKAVDTAEEVNEQLDQVE